MIAEMILAIIVHDRILVACVAKTFPNPRQGTKIEQDKLKFEKREWARGHQYCAWAMTTMYWASQQ